MKTKLLLVIIFMGLGALVFASAAEAATLFLAPPSAEVGVGEKIVVDLKIDSEGVSFNASQATIRFPKDLVEVASLDKTDSAFSFWLEEPTFSNSDGVISFTGGTPYGVSGGSIQILKIIFTPKGSGAGNLSLGDAAITASDGSGTNILSKTVDAALTIVPTKVVSTPKIPTPVEIIRKPTPASGLPVKPRLKVALYPDETAWYNLSSQFTVSWDLPSDISGVSTAVNKQPSFTPAERSEGLFDNKAFSALGDGIWYLHVRFQNNVGWGPTAHYRLAVDTKPPLGFELTILEGERTDNPAPTLQFKTSDALSGLKEYQIRIGDGEPIHLPVSDFKGTFQLPLQSPGKREVVVRAVDIAENSVENRLTLDILPIASPNITFVDRELFSDEEKGLNIKGTALPNSDVLLVVRRMGATVADGIAHSDEKGNWEFTFDQHLKNGNYVVTVQSQDSRGALSLVVESPEVLVKSKPIIQIGKFQLGTGGALIFLLIVIAGGFGGGVWFYKKRQEKLALRVGFAESEIAKIFKLIMDDVEGLAKARQTSTTADDDYALERLRDNIKKMEAYLKRGVEKIKK